MSVMSTFRYIFGRCCDHLHRQPIAVRELVHSVYDYQKYIA